MACIGATVPDMGALSLYELSLEGTSVSLRNPKFCLYLRGPDAARRSPPVDRGRAGRGTRRLVAPDPPAVETRRLPVRPA